MQLTELVTNTNLTAVPYYHHSPIYESNRPGDGAGRVVGLSFLLLRWTSFIGSLISGDDESNLVIVLESQCSGISAADQLVISFKIGDNASVKSFTGKDEHDPRYDDLIQTIDLVDLDIDPSTLPEGLCIPKVSQSSGNVGLDIAIMSSLTSYPSFPSRLL